MERSGIVYGDGYTLSRTDIVDWVDRIYPHAEVFPDGRWQALKEPEYLSEVRSAPSSSTVAVFSSDAVYYPGLVVAVASFKFHHPDVHAVILDCGLTPSQVRYLAQFAEIKSAGAYVPECPAWARFEASCLPYRRVVYFDSDVVVLARLDTLLSTEAEFAAVRNIDWTVRDNFRSSIMLEKHGVDLDAPAFNAGVFAIDNRVWGNGRLLAEALVVWSAIKDECLYPDQSVLHVLMYSKGRISFIDGTYNAIAEFWDWRRDGAPRVVHFAGDETKPWHPHCAYPGLEFFFAYSKIVRDLPVGEK